MRPTAGETAAYLDARSRWTAYAPRVRLNVAAATGFELSGAAMPTGCGLFRTEFLYLKGGPAARRGGAVPDL